MYTTEIRWEVTILRQELRIGERKIIQEERVIYNSIVRKYLYVHIRNIALYILEWNYIFLLCFLLIYLIFAVRHLKFENLSSQQNHQIDR